MPSFLSRRTRADKNCRHKLMDKFRILNIIFPEHNKQMPGLNIRRRLLNATFKVQFSSITCKDYPVKASHASVITHFINAFKIRYRKPAFGSCSEVRHS